MTTSFTKTQYMGACVLVLLMAVAWLAFGTKKQEIIQPVVQGDTIASWNFTGLYANNPELVTKTQTEIERLKSLIGKSKDVTDYSLYASIAAQYELLGDGAKAYEYINKALVIDSDKTGLAWANLGGLMERLGALQTARTAYAKAVEAQPVVMEYHLSRLSLLIQHFPKDTVAVDGAFSDATKQFGEVSQVLQIKAQWLADTGKYVEAIDAWKKVSALAGANPGIDLEIKRLEAKL